MSECVLFTGSVSKSGYGVLTVDGVRVYAHRHAYVQAFGEIPPGLQVDHVWTRGCRSRLCINPDHLEAVTQQENIRRQLAARQRFNPATHCHADHRWTNQNMRLDSKGRRVCRACMREHQRRYRARKFAERESVAGAA